MSGELPPRVIVIEPDQWTRSLTRAALREIGYDAVGALDPAHARRQHERAGPRGPVRVVSVAQLVDAVRNLDPLPADAQHPIDDLAEPFDNF